MKQLFLIFLVILFSCNSDLKKVEKRNKVEQNTEKTKTESKKSEKSEYNENDCVFDQKTQTDEFLKGIKELKNYKWNYKTRTAKLKFENGDSLTIIRGGCADFGVSVKMKILKSSIDYSKWKNVNQKVLWIAKILKSEFAYKKLKTELETNRITIEKEGKGDIVEFTNEFLSMNHYYIYRELHNNFDLIELSYYIN